MEQAVPYPVRTFKGSRERVNCVAFHPMMSQIASGSDDSSICLWNVEDNRFSFKLVGHKGPVQEISFSPTGAVLASASKDGTVKVWNNKYDGSFSTLKNHSDGVNSVQFFNQGANLISAGDDKSVVVWSYEGLKPITQFEGHSKPVNSVRVSHDSKVCITGSDDGFVKVWTLERGIDLISFNESRCIYSVRLNPESNCIATSGEDAFVRLHDIRSRFEIFSFRDHQGASNSIDFHPNQPYLISGGEDAKVRIFDLRNHKCLRTINANHVGTNSVAFSKYGDYFGCGGEDKMVMIWKSTFAEETGREKITQANQQIGLIQDTDTPLHPRSHMEGMHYINYLKKVTNGKSANGKTVYNQKHPEYQGVAGVQGATAAQPTSGPGTRFVLNHDLASKLEKINANLEMIDKTVQVMSHRISNNEKALDGLIDYMSEKYRSDVRADLERGETLQLGATPKTGRLGGVDKQEKLYHAGSAGRASDASLF